MNYLKRRLAVFLCAAIALTSALCMTPQTEVQAETMTNVYMSAEFSYSYMATPEGAHYSAQVEAGQTFDLKNYVCAYTYIDDNYTEFTDGYTFTSSDTSVASINASGMITTKKAGSTLVTVTYGSSSRIIALEVKSAGSLTTAEIRSTNKKIDSLISKASKGIKANNCYAVFNLKTEIYEALGSNVNTMNGIKFETINGSPYNTSANKIVVPKMSQVRNILGELYVYSAKYSPIATTQSKWFKIKSVKASAKTDSATITLSKKVTANQLFSIQSTGGYYESDTNISSKGKATFAMVVQDVKTRYKYYSIATVKKGSNKVTVEMLRGNFKKGRKYRLIGENADTSIKGMKYGWAKGKTFTCK